MTVGRETDSDFRVESAGVAPRHAIFREVQGKWLVESVCDQSLIVGDGRATQLAWLGSRDKVRLGPSSPELLFELAATGPADRPAGDSGSPVRSREPAGLPNTRPTRIPSWLSAAGGLAAVLMLAFFFWRSQSSVSPTVADNPSTPVPAALPMPGGTANEPIEPADSSQPKPVPSVAGSAVRSAPADPADFVVLVGIADFTSDNRPHLLGVGWLWNDRTVIVPRTIGDTLAAVVQKTRERGQPRSGCVICGIPLEVESIGSSPELSEISILKLAKSADLPAQPSEHWRRVGAGDVQRIRERREHLQYVSYARLPRPESVKGKHDFSLIAYNPELVSVVTTEPKLEYEERRHILKPDEASPVERGGLIADRQGRIMGMVLLDAQVLWTTDLERGLANLSGTR